MIFMFLFKKNHFRFVYPLLFFIILIGCQLQEPNKNHGVLFLENRAKKLQINNSNKNDVVKIFGQPHTLSIKNENTWIYFERTIAKGAIYKLGKNVLKTNNVLLLGFDKYGVLNDIVFLDKNDINDLNFSEKETKNSLTEKSVVANFLQSIKQKMYGNR